MNLGSLKAYFNLATLVLRSNFGELPRPYKLTYAITNRCHSKCKHCQIWKRTVTNELHLDEIRQLAQNSPFLAWIDFTGGEPTDRDDFALIVSTFIQHCPKLLLVHFPTNGLNPTRIAETAQEIAKLKPPRLVISVSLDGPPAVHNELRGIPGAFERSLRTFSLLKKQGLEVYLGLTLCRQNMSLLEETFQSVQEHIHDITWEHFHVNLPHLSEHFYHNSALPNLSCIEMIDSLSHFMNKRPHTFSPFSWLEKSYHRLSLQYLKTGRCPLPCAAISSSCFLNPEGTVYPCSMWSVELGNIRSSNYNLLPILSHQRTKNARHILLDKECPNCWTPCEAYQSILAQACHFNDFPLALTKSL
jgi:MoaA/NifB/PqqE/SkfB family radical SAM enzyme